MATVIADAVARKFSMDYRRSMDAARSRSQVSLAQFRSSSKIPRDSQDARRKASSIPTLSSPAAASGGFDAKDDTPVPPLPDDPNLTSIRPPPPTRRRTSMSVTSPAEPQPGLDGFYFHDPTQPPPLNYSLHTRKLSIAIFWTLILIDSIAIPLVLYFTLWNLTSLSANAVFSISTGCLGGISIIEYFLRFWRLWRKSSTCRVVGAGAHRWYLDWFHWNFSAAWFFIMVELIVGTAFDDPPIRLLAMPASTLLWWFGCVLLLQDVLRLTGRRSPVRISSVPKGEPFRPAIYAIIEDVCAVDGSGGTEYRTQLNERYEASIHFRQMLNRLSLFCEVGALGAATVTTILVFTIQYQAAYIVGWVLPFLWAGVWVLSTVWYVKKCLKFERQEWGKADA